MLEWTGERYLPFIDPMISGAEIHYEHLHRYAFATRFTKQKIVLDLASGEGYGSFILSKGAKKVIGVEIEKTTVEHASASYPRENLEFIQGSILDIPLEGEKIFDVAVCFEAMEHVQDHKKLLSEVKRLLKDDGILIISTPNKIAYSDEPRYNNPFHLNELYFADFMNLLKNYFSNVRTFGQRVYAGSNIWRLSSEGSAISEELVVERNGKCFTFRDEEHKSPLYFIAIASNAQIDKEYNKKSYLIDTSNTILIQKDAQISATRGQLQQLSDQANTFEMAVSERDQKIIALNDRLSGMDKQLSTLIGQTQEILSENGSLKSEISEMQRSITWQLVNKFHGGFVERTCPQDTRRRKYYDLGLKGGRILANEGWNRFLLKFKAYQSSKRITSNGIYYSSGFEITDLSAAEDFTPIDKKVSIVIPTKNAGPDFEYTMEKIRGQRGIRELEIIIVDSGSHDATISIAKNSGAIVYEIKPEEFNHGRTRNYAASKASGDYILFTVQDAIPIGDHWLYSLVRILYDREDVAAVTCRQVPRSDADLFARSAIWNHYRYLQLKEDNIFSIDGDALKLVSSQELRKAAGLDNVCNCIKKDIFDEFKFGETIYAEDLDLGVKLLKKKHKIGFLYSTGVIHSHNRGAEYYLRRGYVESRSLAVILNEVPSTEYRDLDVVIYTLLSIYDSLRFSINLLNIRRDVNMEEVFSEVKSNLFSEIRYDLSDKYSKNELDETLNNLRKFIKLNSEKSPAIYNEYIHLLDRFKEYLEVTSQSYEDLELFDLIYKLFAISCGTCLGRSSYYNLDDERIEYMNNILSKGI